MRIIITSMNTDVDVWIKFIDGGVFWEFYIIL